MAQPHAASQPLAGASQSACLAERTWPASGAEPRGCPSSQTSIENLRRLVVWVNEQWVSRDYWGNFAGLREKRNLTRKRSLLGKKETPRICGVSEASDLLAQIRIKFQARILRRTMPARPTRPVPSKPRVPGSGVTSTSKSPLTAPVRPTTNWNPAITGLPPVVAIMLITPFVFVTVPLKVPVNKSALLLFQTET